MMFGTNRMNLDQFPEPGIYISLERGWLKGPQVGKLTPNKITCGFVCAANALI